MPQAAGIPFGHYVLRKRIARGGMAEVFLAHQRGMGGFDRRVAVKRILPHLVEDASFVRMFHDEARLAARLTHPNIVHIYEFGQVDEHYFIAMEYVQGIHAGQIIQHGGGELLPFALVARIGADACSGLRYAHRLPDDSGRALEIVHRDVSPPNLMITYDGVVKLVDFGIAKAVSQVEQTRPGVVKGKYAYMSPEQTTNSKLDGRSDVFSLGLVLWELLAGRVALDRADPVEVMRTIRDGKLAPIETVRRDIPAALATAVGAALEVDVSVRPSAAELGLMLEGYIKSSPEMATSLQLAEWIGARFHRSNTTSEQPALNAGTRRGTVAATQASVISATAATQLADSEMTALIRPAPSLPTPRGAKASRGPGSRTPSVLAAHAVGTRDRATSTPLAATHRSRITGRTWRIGIAALVTAIAGAGIYSIATDGRSRGGQTAVKTTASSAATEINAGPHPTVARIPEPPDAAPLPKVDAGPRVAVVEIITDPGNATVSLGADRPVATSPAIFRDLPAGEHSLLIELDGYEVIERTIQVNPGDDRSIEFPLRRIAPPTPSIPQISTKKTKASTTRKRTRPRKRTKRRRPGRKRLGKLTARTIPYSVVFLGKRKLGVTPFANVALPVGRHTLTFKSPGKPAVRRHVTIRANKTTKLKFRLSRK